MDVDWVVAELVDVAVAAVTVAAVATVVGVAVVATFQSYWNYLDEILDWESCLAWHKDY